MIGISFKAISFLPAQKTAWVKSGTAYPTLCPVSVFIMRALPFKSRFCFLTRQNALSSVHCMDCI